MKRVELVRGDITELQVDAIVNAANSSLLGGGGVDGAIHRKGGPDIIKACMEIRQMQGECAPGQAVITPAGLLRARYVIHTVGPVWRGGLHDEEVLLANAYRNSLELARQHDVSGIAFPNISTGAYGFPKSKAAKIATAAVSDFLKDDRVIKSVVFCCFDEENYRLYTSILNISS